MGQKVNPIGLRLGINKNWFSRWFPSTQYAPFNILEDHKIREFLKREMYYAGVSEIMIERAAHKIRVTVVASKPGLIIGKKGADIDKHKELLKKIIRKDVAINIKEVKRPQTNAQLGAENIATQLEKRVSFRRAMKKVMQTALKNGAKGIKIKVSGRLAGAEMARTEWYMEGRVPLHTLRAKIDYGFAEAMTTYGIIGVKVWIFKGEVLQKGIIQEYEFKRERDKRESYLNENRQIENRSRQRRGRQ
ncbi:MAG: 30S ribosomal protein S3 [Helicobacter sp.]|uniref:30S ribosomal protein S3 n=1 Tax=Helicobacter sp. 10-6591 TaxID=2004998 RepID=UPI000DCEF2BF|nr:30S ribosomal protein S3 [Helicobacter sp. 10-6591]MCI7485189.1 30S ribosomal protein S3 [Helicobacter sp.]MDD7567514.1 30S ribosomal protein S3 [Helicobacter sp.]MDY5741038.1 30S ribosomal protein S3 [Helicobacter sp.]RAX54345.1 30S ribosomal protein S3 [Helicobacter sp. 10-6591]